MKGALGLAAVLAAASLACEQPKIDASSQEALGASAEAVRGSLPPTQEAEFDEALKEIMGAALQAKMGQVFARALAGEDPQAAGDVMAGEVFEDLNGLTADQVIARGRDLRAERLERERQQALSEIEELRLKVSDLEEKRRAADQARGQLESVEVLRSRFYKRDQKFMGPQPVIELTVRNGTEHAISRAYFHGTLATPGRAVPWLREDFNYGIKGGLEPGEQQDWSLAPSMFSDWGNVDVRPDMVFTAKAYRVDGADGELLFAVDWNEADEERLAKARERLEALEIQHVSGS